MHGGHASSTAENKACRCAAWLCLWRLLAWPVLRAWLGRRRHCARPVCIGMARVGPEGVHEGMRTDILQSVPCPTGSLAVDFCSRRATCQAERTFCWHKALSFTWRPHNWASTSKTGVSTQASSLEVALTMDSQWTPNGLPMDTQWTPQWTPNGHPRKPSESLIRGENVRQLKYILERGAFAILNSFRGCPLGVHWGVHWVSIGCPLGVHWDAR